jgi:hypothetical protein
MCIRRIIRQAAQLHGIDANPKKVEAIEQLQPLQTRREIQKLVGKMVVLNQFICRLGEHGMPFYKLL